MSESNNDDVRVYELAYLFVPTIAESDILGRFSQLKALFEGAGATFISEELPKDLALAYEMSRVINNKKIRFNNAYFGWIKFALEPEKLEAIETVIKRDEEIIRYMILKTVRENTITGKKTFSREGARTKRTYEKKVEVTGEPMDKEAIDKEIDALVDETATA